MQKLLLLTLLWLASFSLSAQLIITDPAAPTDDQAVTITFDATEGTGGLADCNCDIYLHTGVITSNSTGMSDWQYVQTEWGVANEAWKLSPVTGEANKYTYTYGPDIRTYFGVPAGEAIEQIAFVFRNADGSLEGKASGGADIFVDVTAGGVLGITLAGDPGQDHWALGKPLSLLAGVTREATIEIFDNDNLLTSATGTELAYDVIFTEAGPHTVKVVATSGDQTVMEEFSLDARLEAVFTAPANDIITASPGAVVQLEGTSYVMADLVISDGNNEVFSATAADFDQSVTLPSGNVVTYTLTATYQEETTTDRVTFVTGDPERAEPPAGLRAGAVDMPNGDVTLQLRAPGKSDVFVLGNFNNWTPTAASRMKRSGNDTTFWLTVTGLEAEEDLIYQYLIDGDIRQPDPYSTLVLDPGNDPFIDDNTFADLPDYPTDLASGILSWHLRGAPSYDWQTGSEYQRPDPKKMVVYELLIRDFLEDHSYTSLTDSLDYLQRLGVNTIELMPVSEFEGNISWGYNVSYHMALDKYYGSPDDLKAFVDACHARGMAVVLDVVYNHAFGQSALARMWWDEANFRPTPDNPYLNVEAKHPFNVGYDFNHDSPLTQEYVKNTLQYWIEEFRVDGFRFDLSKGFTQNFSNDVSAWNRYDADRVARIKDYADFVWSVDPETYMIMEHLAEVREEKELANYGNEMYFWTGGGLHNQYLEASMGYTSNLRGALATNNGFDGLHQMGYMESHDEERMQVKNEKFGNSAGSYDVREEDTGLERIELASTFFYTVPGPKMLWQFGELGYDFAINYCSNGTENEACRTDPKPIRWDYRADSDRQDVYDWIADLLYLRNNYDFFHGEVMRQDLSGPGKVLHLRGTDGEVAIVGNFGVESLPVNNPFPSAGDWYDYEGNRTETISDPGAPLTLAPGEFRVYLSEVIVRNGDNNIGTSANEVAVARLGLEVMPNPTAGPLQLGFSLPKAGRVDVDLLDVSGRRLRTLFAGTLGAGAQSLDMNAGVPAGLYFLRVSDGLGSAVKRIVIR